MRVPVVEDQAELADEIADGLRDQGIGADVAYDGPAGIEKAFEELVARVRSLARRAPAAAPVIVRGDIMFDRARRGQPGGPPLTRKRWASSRSSWPQTGAWSVPRTCWSGSDENADPFTRTVTVTIGRLRRKLGEPDPIDTVVGSGYRLP